ncbi:hypothetical protein [Chlamydiifrater volucris]|uniref:hypothetical protein n=1 Tax=Chlamydiifrater volucris TaxID=2681470 RepID=UPI001BCCCF6E|nr:hypothetical protein [Chlamydiifrater volucris]
MKKEKKNHPIQTKTFSTNCSSIEVNSTNISLGKKLDMKKKKITKIGQPAYEEDIVPLGYLRSKFIDKKDKETGYLPTKGGNMHGEINMGGERIKNIQFPIEEKKLCSKTIKELPEKERTSAVNVVSVLETVNAIKEDPYLDKVEEVIEKLQPKIKKLEDLLKIESPPPLENKINPTPELSSFKISRCKEEKTTLKEISLSSTAENREAPYVKMTGDSMTSNLKMGDKSIRGLPASPQKETDAISLSYLRKKFACGGCVMQGPINLSPKNPNPIAFSDSLTSSIARINNLKTPSITEASYASNLEFIKQRLPGESSSFISMINESKTYVLKDGNFAWGIGVNNQSSESYKYASISGTSLQLKPRALYTLCWTAIISINSTDFLESEKDSNNTPSTFLLETDEPPKQGKLMLKLMPPLSSLESPKFIINKTTPDPDTGETPPEPKPKPIASTTIAYPSKDSFVSLSCQVPLPITFSAAPEMKNTDTYSLYLEFDSSVKIEYSSWNLLIRPFKEGTDTMS